MSKVQRFGVSLEEELLEELDALVEKHGFPNRSQAIRYLIRNNRVEEAWAENREVAGALILVFDHHRNSLVNESLKVQHDFHDIILATQHVHVDHDQCMEIIALRGQASQLTHLSNRLIALKGMIHGRLVMSGV